MSAGLRRFVGPQPETPPVPGVGEKQRAAPGEAWQPRVWWEDGAQHVELGGRTILPVTELNLDAVAPAMDALGQLPLDTINVGLRWDVQMPFTQSAAQ